MLHLISFMSFLGISHRISYHRDQDLVCKFHLDILKIRKIIYFLATSRNSRNTTYYDNLHEGLSHNIQRDKYRNSNHHEHHRYTWRPRDNSLEFLSYAKVLKGKCQCQLIRALDLEQLANHRLACCSNDE